MTKFKTMKRFLGLISLLFFISACDDGDLIVETIDFESITATKCDTKDIIYKLKDTEILLLQIPDETFLENETLEDEPIEIEITATTNVIYRLYNGQVSSDNICLLVPDATPNVIEEWVTTSGTIQITTTAIKTTDAETNATKITGYKHFIVLKDVIFQKPGGNQTYDLFTFGNYNTTISPLAFGFDEEAVTKSTCDDRVFSFSGGEAFILDVDNFASLFANEQTTTPRKATISGTKKLTYKLFSGTVNNTFFCASPTPSLPALSEEWNAVDGVENISGEIEVTTTSNGPNTYRHTVRLKKVTMKKGNTSFYLGDDILYGSFDTTL